MTERGAMLMVFRALGVYFGAESLFALPNLISLAFSDGLGMDPFDGVLWLAPALLQLVFAAWLIWGSGGLATRWAKQMVGCRVCGYAVDPGETCAECGLHQDTAKDTAATTPNAQ